MNELLGLTLVELTETLRARKSSPVDLMKAVLSRIDETNGDLNAVVHMRDPPRNASAAARPVRSRGSRSG